MPGKSPMQELNDEHQALAADIREIEAAVRALDASQELSWPEHARTLRDRFEMFRRALLLHFRREQEGLFPDAQTMVSQQGSRGDALSQFFAEEGEDDISAHASLSIRADEMISTVGQMAASPGPDQQTLGRLRALVNTTRSLLERHADKETRIIFPMIARALDDEQMEHVGKRMEQLGAAADLVDSSEDQAGDLRDLSVGPE